MNYPTIPPLLTLHKPIALGNAFTWRPSPFYKGMNELDCTKLLGQFQRGHIHSRFAGHPEMQIHKWKISVESPNFNCSYVMEADDTRLMEVYDSMCDGVKQLCDDNPEYAPRIVAVFGWNALADQQQEF
jgi:hypothetical protein